MTEKTDIEALRLIEEGGCAAGADIRDEGVDRLDGRADVARGARHEGEEVGRGEDAAAEIEGLDHGAISLIAASLGNTPRARVLDRA